MLNYTKKNENVDVKNWKYYRVERYRLQSIVRKWFFEEGQKRGLEYPENYHKTAKCLVTRHKYAVEIAKKDQAFYRGLIRCARIWTCPVCAAKIQIVRREEIGKLVNWAYRTGHKCLMVTFTFPHYSCQIAKDLLKRFSKALVYLRGGKQWQFVKQELGFIGLVRGLEVTRGNNGWHIHTHELWIVNKKADVKWINWVLMGRWKEAVNREGLLPGDRIDDFERHGLDVMDNAHSSDYLAKSSWGVEGEIATAHRKSGRGGLSPFDLVKGGRRDEFLEYVKAFHGKRQLFWSPGLKEKAGVEEVADEIAVMEEKADVLGILTPEEWREIVDREARVEILEIAENEGILGVRKWLYSVTGKW
jgi:hypothetical protein